MGYVFDWDKAATIIRERGLKNVDAGLAEDWFWTGDSILKDGKPNFDSRAYLASFWATPVMRYYLGDGEAVEIECWIDSSKTEWNEKTIFPDSALKILDGEE